MIKIDLGSAREFVKDEEFEQAYNKAETSYSQVIDGSGPGNEWLGWRRILKSPDDTELDRIKQSASAIREDADVFIVCGIGGSYLGSKAVIEALNGLLPENKPEIIFAGHHMSGRYLDQLIGYLSEPDSKGEQKSVYINVISKSGSTLETALAFRTLRTWMDKTYGEEAPDRIIATTGPEGGVLNQMIEQYGYEKFVIPDDVGGRFSVLTPVGLLPISVAGIQIQGLIDGAVSKYKEYESSAHDLLEYAAIRYLFERSGKALDVIGSFEPDLNAFTGWIQQLLGESEGKDGKGLFPVSASFSTDLHSIGQMIQQGKRNIIETFLVVEESNSALTVRKNNDDTDGLEYLAGMSYHEINQKALEGTTEAHHNGGVPVIRVSIQKLNNENIGELIYFYELLTAVYVYMLEVNPFDQPGVEDYKKAMYRNLGKI
jgi:glucose-6-phosphate isomerase